MGVAVDNPVSETFRISWRRVSRRGRPTLERSRLARRTAVRLIATSRKTLRLAARETRDCKISWNNSRDTFVTNWVVYTFLPYRINEIHQFVEHVQVAETSGLGAKIIDRY